MSFDVKKDGSGIWFVIHTLALHANTDVLKESFILTINTLCDHFGCDTCKQHFRKFINDYPLKTYWYFKYNGEDLGFFKWSWDLHNVVNKALNKPQLSFDNALSKYKNYICKNCGDKKNPILVEVSSNNTSNTANTSPNITSDQVFTLASFY